MDSETDDIINELVDQNLKELEHQKGLEESERWGADFTFESVDLLYYHLHKASLKRGKLYIKSPE